MDRWLATERFAPILAGGAGLLWFWMELAPQRRAFPDTDDPAMGLAFINAQPTAWPLAGLALGITAVALVASVLSIRPRLAAAGDRSSQPGDAPGSNGDTIAVIGLIAAAMLFGMAAVRMSGGPVRYVQGLDQGWGEAAYLVTQFVGIQALVTGGFVLLELWIVGVAWRGARRGIIPRAVAALAIIPAFRLVGLLGPFGIEFDGVWLLTIVAMPATFAWLALVGIMIRPSAGMTTDDILVPTAAAPVEGVGQLEEANA